MRLSQFFFILCKKVCLASTAYTISASSVSGTLWRKQRTPSFFFFFSYNTNPTPSKKKKIPQMSLSPQFFDPKSFLCL